jgi:hypothetical protein
MVMNQEILAFGLFCLFSGVGVGFIFGALYMIERAKPDHGSAER